MISVLKEERFSRRMQKKIVLIYLDPASFSVGHGVFISTKGVILTAYHLFSSSDFSIGSNVTVKCSDETTYVVEIRAMEERYDLALLEIVKPGKPKLKFKYGVLGEELRIGQGIHMITSTDDKNFIYTRGIVACERRMCDELADRSRIEFIDDKTYFVQGHGLHGVPGSSGAPIFDSRGNVIGIYSTSCGRMDFLVHPILLKEFCKDFIQQTGGSEAEEEEEKEQEESNADREAFLQTGVSEAKEEEEKEQEESNADREAFLQTGVSEAKRKKKKKNRRKVMLIGKLSFKMCYNSQEGKRKRKRQQM